MTAREVYEISLALIDEVENDGSVDAEYTKSYAGRAPRIIDALQRELAFYEGTALTGSIDELDDALEISDDTAERIMPYGLAANFALSDKNTDMYAEYSALYRSLLRTIRTEESAIADEYDVLDGMS
ncbi:MAG: hypothetical protein PHO15_09045 [Eubacteriales bacterium]|nr:hypothetical protein [Eubacteriales bacterium]